MAPPTVPFLRGPHPPHPPPAPCCRQVAWRGGVAVLRGSRVAGEGVFPGGLAPGHPVCAPQVNAAPPTPVCAWIWGDCGRTQPGIPWARCQYRGGGKLCTPLPPPTCTCAHPSCRAGGRDGQAPRPARRPSPLLHGARGSGSWLEQGHVSGVGWGLCSSAATELGAQLCSQWLRPSTLLTAKWNCAAGGWAGWGGSPATLKEEVRQLLGKPAAG